MQIVDRQGIRRTDPDAEERSEFNDDIQAGPCLRPSNDAVLLSPQMVPKCEQIDIQDYAKPNVSHPLLPEVSFSDDHKKILSNVVDNGAIEKSDTLSSQRGIKKRGVQTASSVTTSISLPASTPSISSDCPSLAAADKAGNVTSEKVKFCPTRPVAIHHDSFEGQSTTSDCSANFLAVTALSLRPSNNIEVNKTMPCGPAPGNIPSTTLRASNMQKIRKRFKPLIPSAIAPAVCLAGGLAAALDETSSPRACNQLLVSSAGSCSVGVAEASADKLADSLALVVAVSAEVGILVQISILSKLWCRASWLSWYKLCQIKFRGKRLDDHRSEKHSQKACYKAYYTSRARERSSNIMAIMNHWVGDLALRCCSVPQSSVQSFQGIEESLLSANDCPGQFEVAFRYANPPLDEI